LANVRNTRIQLRTRSGCVLAASDYLGSYATHPRLWGASRYRRSRGDRDPTACADVPYSDHYRANTARLKLGSRCALHPELGSPAQPKCMDRGLWPDLLLTVRWFRD